MQYVFDGQFYKVVKVTGPRHNLLGLSFGECAEPAVIALGDDKSHAIVAEEVLQQVISGVDDMNAKLGTTYLVKQIQFVLSDTPSNSIYRELAQSIVKRLHEAGEFTRV
jgi:hypothetical protein